jgi:flavin prenyltransferase
MGVAIVPPVPSLYNHPEAIGDIVDYFIARVLDQFGLAAPAANRWAGLAAAERK